MYRRWILGSLMVVSLTSCTLKDHVYDPAMPARRHLWQNEVPLMLQGHQGGSYGLFGQDVCPASLPPTPQRGVPSMVPTDAEWGTWKRAPEAKTVCTGKGKKRVCKKVAPSVVQEAKKGALIKPARRYVDNSGRVQYPFTPGADNIFQVEVGTMSPTYLQLPAGEQLAGTLKLSSDAWASTVIQQGHDRQYRQTVILGAKETGTEAYTAAQFVSGLDIWLKLVAVEGAGMMTVSWEMPAPVTTPDMIPVAQRPPKINMERIHTQYTLEVEGKHTPPWMPTGAFDDGTRTYVYFKEPLTYTRAPGVFALDQKGQMNLTQSHMFIKDNDDGHAAGAYIVIQGLWPAIRLQDSSGMQVRLTRQNPQY